ncbi:MAG: amidohydrolase [Gammaproteobacteria bacterium]|nr:amidohydrolase [Gammaproteobacteria bacterium]
MNIKNLIIVAILFHIVACSQSSPVTSKYSEKQADSVYLNAKVYTVNDESSWAEAVAIKGDEIIFVGSDKNVKALIGNNTKVTDLQGAMLLPGFIDSHSHPVAGGAYALLLSLDTYAQPEDWVKAIADYADSNKDLPVIFGYGFLASAFKNDGPTKEIIDSVVADRPVLIMDEGFHGAWANSKLLAQLGINKETPDPVPGFSYYKRDKEGNPTGYLLEGTAEQAIKQLNVITESSVVKGTKVVIEQMNRYGITAVFDAGALDVIEYQHNVLNTLKEKNQLNVHYVGAYMVAEPKKMKSALEKVQSLRKTSPYISMLKIMNDGTVEGKTAAMFTDYQNDPGNKGNTVFTPEQLQWLISKATSLELDVHIHALGERAISDTLDAIAFSKIKHPNSESRFTITHIQVLADPDIQRFADLGVIAQSTPLWGSYDTEGKKFVSDDQFNRYFRFNSLQKAGVKLSFGSDFPASGAGMLGMSPLYNMEIGNTRQMAGQKNSLVQPAKNERLDIANLIRGYTIDAAYQLRLADKIGSIEIGKKADLVVLEKNLFEIDPYSIHKNEVIMTIFAGKVVYSR